MDRLLESNRFEAFFDVQHLCRLDGIWVVILSYACENLLQKPTVHQSSNVTCRSLKMGEGPINRIFHKMETSLFIRSQVG